MGIIIGIYTEMKAASLIYFYFFIAKMLEIYRNRETRHECIPTKNSHILDLRASNYGII